MRRFASVFAGKRRDESANSAAPSVAAARSPSSVFSTPQLSIASDPAHSSGSSSGASICPQTPDDEHPIVLNTKRSWRSWIGATRSLSLKHRPHADRPDWDSRPPLSPFLPPPSKNSPMHPLPHDDTDDDDPSEQSDSEPLSFSPPASPARAKENICILTKNALVPPLPVSPFVQHSLGPIFPRSSNRPNLLSQQPPMRVTILKNHLLSRLETTDLASADLAVITPFAVKLSPSPLGPPPASFPDISRPSKSTRIFSASPGVRRWIARPCFEDRYLVYLAAETGVDCRPVSAASLAIAALEYSEYLDAMVDPDFDQSPPQSGKNVYDAWSPSTTELTIAATASHASLDPTPVSAPPPHSRNSYTAVPSPLRNEHNSPPTSSGPMDPSPKPAKSMVKRVVRFLEEDSDDGIPLHVVRMKKKREQKAMFLRQEQLRRAKEEKEERLQQEQEAMESERRRLAMEKEKKEREKALYAEAIAAARVRRETQRAGGLPSSNINSSVDLLVPSTSSTSLRDFERNRPPQSRRHSSRLPHDALPMPMPRRETSDSALHRNSPSSYHQPPDSSPRSSRPPSITHSHVSPTGHDFHSRPSSTYSTHTSSSEDVRQHSGSRRNSTTAAAVAAGGMGSASAYGLPPMIMSYPTWSGSNPNFQYVPPVPQFPDFVHDMPLLPPTAPFMKHSYERRSSRNSSPGGSRSSESRRGSVNSSTERVNQVPEPMPPMSRTASTPRQSVSASPRKSDPVVPSQAHSRRGSSDSRNTPRTQQSTTQRPIPSSSHSHPILSRGRPLQPGNSSSMPTPPPSSQVLQAPNPWTAVPSRSGRTPVAMPVSPYSHNLDSPANMRNSSVVGGGGTRNGRRQTVAS